VVIGPVPELFFTYDFQYVHSEQEVVTLALEDVPAGLWHRFSPGSGEPSFSCKLFMADSGVAPGSYQMTLVATGERSGRQAFPFKLVVLAPKECSNLATGKHLNTYNACASADPYFQDISAVPGQVSKVLFSNFNNNGAAVYGFVHCDWQAVIIPLQTVNGINYEGDGRFITSNNQRTLQIIFSEDGKPCFMEIDML
jgi:hypothetical protein